jgi:hypothetical protein
MAMSIAELDSTVRTFYEGRGEAASTLKDTILAGHDTDLTIKQQKQAQTALNQVSPPSPSVCLATLN